MRSAAYCLTPPPAECCRSPPHSCSLADTHIATSFLLNTGNSGASFRLQGEYKRTEGRTVLRKLNAIVFVLCLLATAAFAQVPTAGYAYFGYSLNHGSVDPLANHLTMNGWQATVEGRILPHIGLVADFAQQFGSTTIFFPGTAFDMDVRTEQYLFGPRVAFRVGPARPFVHFLVGAAHVHEENHFFLFDDSDTSFAYAGGGGLDYRLSGPLNWRIQVESLNTNFFHDWQHNVRFSTGLSVRF